MKYLEKYEGALSNLSIDKVENGFVVFFNKPDGCFSSSDVPLYSHVARNKVEALDVLEKLLPLMKSDGEIEEERTKKEETHRKSLGEENDESTE